MRLGLTTTPDRIDDLVPVAAAHGFDPVGLPCVRVDGVAEGVERLAVAASSADVVVLTSARAVGMLVSAGAMSLPVIAVGPETATAVERAGGTVSWVGSGGVAQLGRDAGHLLADKRIVVAGASNAARENATALEREGSTVIVVDVYTTIPVAPPGDPVDAVVFGSPSAVAGWLMSRELSGLLVAAIGPTTAAALRTSGVEPHVVPAHPGFKNMIAQLAGLRLERSTQ